MMINDYIQDALGTYWGKIRTYIAAVDKLNLAYKNNYITYQEYNEARYLEGLNVPVLVRGVSR